MDKYIELYRNEEISEMEFLSQLRDYFNSEVLRLESVEAGLASFGFDLKMSNWHKLHVITNRILNEDYPSLQKADHMIDLIKNYNNKDPKGLRFTIYPN